MLFGHNSNVKVGETTFHVQTEDRGVTTALIDTTVYYAGRVMHRRTNNYHDLIPLNPDREEALRLRLDEQHRSTLEDIKSGVLHLAAPPLQTSPLATQAPATNGASPAVPEPVKLELRNARTWLTGRQARLEINVANLSGQPLQGMKVTAHVEGAATAEKFSSESNAEGNVEISFTMPKLAGADAALVVEALQTHSDQPSRASHHGKLRFALRTKPKAAQ
jgi:hypothetical protein